MIKISEVLKQEKLLFLHSLNKTGALDSEERGLDERIINILEDRVKLFSACSIDLNEKNLETYVFGTFGVGFTEGEISRASNSDMGYLKENENVTMQKYPEINSVQQFMKTMRNRVNENNEILVRNTQVSYLYVINQLYNIEGSDVLDLAKKFHLPLYYLKNNKYLKMMYPESIEVNIDYVNSFNLKR